MERQIGGITTKLLSDYQQRCFRYVDIVPQKSKDCIFDTQPK